MRYTCSLTHSAACVVTQCSSRQLYRQHNILCSAIVYSMNTLRDDEEFTIISDEEVKQAEKEEDLEEKFAAQDDEIERTIDQIKSERLSVELTEKELTELVEELRHLEERLHLWREVRLNTILQLRQIADYIDSVARKTGIARVVGSSGGKESKILGSDDRTFLSGLTQ